MRREGRGGLTRSRGCTVWSVNFNSSAKPRLNGPDDGPDTLRVGHFEEFLGEAQQGSRLLFAPARLSCFVDRYAISRSSIKPPAVQVAGQPSVVFFPPATRTPRSGPGAAMGSEGRHV